MNCDRLARFYSAFEHLAFGACLETYRFAFLGDALAARRALLLGEGDGRFMCELASRNRTVQIDYVEASKGMMEVAKCRLLKAAITSPQRIRLTQADVHSPGPNGNAPYDLVVSHFFFDCFSDEDAARIVGSVRRSCEFGTKWLIADFALPRHGWKRWHAVVWLRIMYGFFRATTGLTTRSLPDHGAAMRAAGFVLRNRRTSMTELIASELWELAA